MRSQSRIEGHDPGSRQGPVSVAGYGAVAGSDYSKALACFQEGLALFTPLGDERGISWSLRGRGVATVLGGNAEEALLHVKQSLALCCRTGDGWGEAWSIFDLGHIAFALGAIERAQPLIEDALHRFRQIDVLFGAYRALILLGDIQRRYSRWAEAMAHYAEALQLEQEDRFVQFGADLLEGLAKIAAMQRQPDTTARLFGAGHTWRLTFGQARSFFYEPGYQRILAIARAQLAEKDWSACYAAGRNLTSEQAMAEARRMARLLASAPQAPYPTSLTEREIEVLRLVVEGLKDQEIADQLVVSPRTVHAHLRSIYGKLGVNTRTAAAHEAMQLKLT